MKSKNDLTDIYLIVAKNIKKYRKLAKMTQFELAKKTGYSYGYIRLVEAPKCIKKFSLESIYYIALALDIDIDKLFSSDDI